ncbi:hypothetical protein HMPREF3232_01136 [Fannyhessea vaginae]|uniref:Uncharacterized protein n=1 Tax=Fannyhessea vaginae DSM 15829 TaxID=525256 RepID=F1T3Y9_9ACTN|nr:hypothetical protein HMPREF0091_10380 [Fannyhessea vaginae DSM 15829]KXG88827.1 hypothetical protein HMPREF3232_01136 [Fannyhessea vaginae]
MYKTTRRNKKVAGYKPATCTYAVNMCFVAARKHMFTQRSTIY